MIPKSRPTEHIRGMQFGVLTDNEKRLRSVCKVTTHEMYEGGRPKQGGVFDARMGVLDNRSLCPTDELGYIESPGWFGHIELAMPVLSFSYMKWIVKTLRCVCPICSNLRFDMADPATLERMQGLEGMARMTKAVKLSERRKVCDRCGNRLPRIVKKDRMLIHCIQLIYRMDKTDRTVQIPPERVREIFEGITDEDCRSIGFKPEVTRPESFVMSVLSVPPPSMRPPVRKNSQQPQNDDLTYKIGDIIKANRALAEYIERIRNRHAEEGEPDADAAAAEANALDCYRRGLQYNIAVMSDNTIQGLPQAQQRSGRPLKCIKGRIKSKEGRVRGNLNGKRVNHSARSVITPDPNLSINELGVPRIIACKMTFPVVVTAFNASIIRDIVRNGAATYPGCNRVELMREGRKRVFAMDIGSMTRPERRAQVADDLRVGDIVHRHLLDGDTVLFNRQPSLHRMSMMAHRVRVLPFETFRINVNCTSPYNADFDGDEMNMHVPQSIAASVELREIANVDRQIVSPGTNKPVIKIVQDALLGMSMVTSEETQFGRDQAMDVLMWSPEFQGFGKGAFRGKIRGKDLVEKHVLPFIDGLNIPEGVTFKSTANRLVHETFNDYGRRLTRKLLDNMNHTAMRWLLSNGFSVGLGDLFVDQSVLTKMHEKRGEAKRKVLDIICTVHDGRFRNNTSLSNEQEFERQVMQSLSSSLNSISKVAMKTIDPKKNRLMRMIDAGSKGSSFNFSQMVAMIGQQALAGKRVGYGFTDRTLPHFHRFDDGVRARGFVSSSYIDGLEPTELFFHAQAGREGLIDTAVKTAETGYIQRRMVKAMENIVVAEDGTVRNVMGNIVQMRYGGDGFDVTNLENVKLPDWFVEAKWGGVPDNIATELRRLRSKVAPVVSDDQSVCIPINLPRILKHAIRQQSPSAGQSAVASDSDIHERGQRLLERLRQDGQRNLWLWNIHTNVSLEVAIRVFFTAKFLKEERSLKRLPVVRVGHLEEVASEVLRLLPRKLASPGEPVGIIGAQSLGEPATQMTLNTFHAAGVSEKSNVIRGVPRLEEIIRVTKNMQAPSTTVVPKEGTSRPVVDRLRNHIIQTRMSDILKRSEIVYEPRGARALPDMSHLGVYSLLADIISNASDASGAGGDDAPAQWVLSFTFDRFKMLQHEVRMETVYRAVVTMLRRSYGPDYADIAITYSDDSAGYLAMRLSMPIAGDSGGNESDEESSDASDDGDAQNDADMLMMLKRIESEIVDNVGIGGVTGVSGGRMRQIKTVLPCQHMRATAHSGDDRATERYVIDTSGTNLRAILSEPAVDSVHTTTNDITEAHRVLGIEAARQTIIDEFQEVVSSAKTYVNSHHIALLADTMTRKGTIVSVDRHGINRNTTDNGVLSRASFEKTMETLLEASVFGEYDNMQGVSANVMFGQPIRIGTGCVDVVVEEPASETPVGASRQTYEPGAWSTVCLPTF